MLSKPRDFAGLGYFWPGFQWEVDEELLYPPIKSDCARRRVMPCAGIPNIVNTPCRSLGGSGRRMVGPFH